MDGAAVYSDEDETRWEERLRKIGTDARPEKPE